MARMRAIRGKASKVGTAVHPLGVTDQQNAADSRAANRILGMLGRGVKASGGRRAKGTLDPRRSVPGAGADAIKGSKVRGGGDITGGGI